MHILNKCQGLKKALGGLEQLIVEIFRSDTQPKTVRWAYRPTLLILNWWRTGRYSPVLLKAKRSFATMTPEGLEPSAQRLRLLCFDVHSVVYSG